MASGGKSESRENGSNKPNPLPSIADSCEPNEMVRNAMKKASPDDRLRLVVWSYRQSGGGREPSLSSAHVGTREPSPCETHGPRPDAHDARG